MDDGDGWSRVGLDSSDGGVVLPMIIVLFQGGRVEEQKTKNKYKEQRNKNKKQEQLLDFQTVDL